jgi:flavin reductase (DIM6/NTAB) family NADH-FMN oxidoreductase RutF
MQIDCASAEARQVSRLLKSIVVPRPIGWISTIGPGGIANLAPYSFFNAVEDRPPIVMFASGGLKHSARNARDNGEFVVNLVTEPLLEAMSLTSAPLPDGQSEFEAAGLAMAPSVLIRPPRVAAAAAALECKLLEIRQPHDLLGRLLETYIVFGQVVMIHADSRVLADARVDATAEPVAARLGGMEYTLVRDVRSLERPPGG